MPTKSRKIIRLKEYDYSQPGYYFITICTANRRCIFGEVDHDRLVLSNIGEIVNKWWHNISEHFPNVELDEMQIMPNHVHAIVIIKSEARAGSANPNAFLGMPTLGQIVAYWKYQVVKEIHRDLSPTMDIWQDRYFDRILRDEKALEAARNYIRENPLKWSLDSENPARVS
jgi:REP element-mobilizing transposase RayT